MTRHFEISVPVMVPVTVDDAGIPTFGTPIVEVEAMFDTFTVYETSESRAAMGINDGGAWNADDPAVYDAAGGEPTYRRACNLVADLFRRHA